MVIQFLRPLEIHYPKKSLSSSSIYKHQFQDPLNKIICALIKNLKLLLISKIYAHSMPTGLNVRADDITDSVA